MKQGLSNVFYVVFILTTFSAVFIINETSAPFIAFIAAISGIIILEIDEKLTNPISRILCKIASYIQLIYACIHFFS